MMAADHTPRPLVVLGLGQSQTPLGDAATADLDRAEILYGASSLLAQFAGHPATPMPMSRDLDADAAALLRLADAGRRVVVLADGDGLFFGLGASLATRLPQARLYAHPHLDAVSLAASRFGLPRSAMKTVSAHGRSHLGELWQALSCCALTAVYTDPTHTPAFLAKTLAARLQGDPLADERFELCIAESLGAAGERLSRLRLSEAARFEAAQPNVVIFRRLREFEPITLGRDAADYGAASQPVTKPMVRAAILAALALGPGQTLWDLGAGSGSVSIEAWPLLSPGRILAVESKPDRVERLRANIARFGALGVEVVAGPMLAHMSALPRPQRIFIGGGLSGQQSQDILELALQQLLPGGRLVAATVLLESLFALTQQRRYMSDFAAEVTQLGVSQSCALGEGLRLVPENPVFLVSLKRNEAI